MSSRPSNRPSPLPRRLHPYSLSRPRHPRNRSKPNLPGRRPLVTRPAVRRRLKRRLKQHLRRRHWSRLRRSLNRPRPKPSLNRHPKCQRLGSSVLLPRRTPARHHRVSNRGAEGNRARTSRVLVRPAVVSRPRASLRAASLPAVRLGAMSRQDVSPRRVVKAALVKLVRVRALQARAPRASLPPEPLAHVVPLVRRLPRSRRLGTVARARARRRTVLRSPRARQSRHSLSRPSSDSHRTEPARPIGIVRRSCPTPSRSSPSRNIATSVFNGRALSGTTVPCSKCSSSTAVLTSIDASTSPR
jgi:hypothetical protein